MLAISAPTVDPLGHVVINTIGEEISPQVRRRVTKTMTLEADNVFIDRGYALSDQELTATWMSYTSVEVLMVKRMMTLYTRLIMSSPLGLHLIVITDLSARSNAWTLKWHIAETLVEA